MYILDDFDFLLPEELIAQHPLPERSDSRLFILNRKTGKHDHKHFFDLPSLLKKDDLLVLNDARVLSARIFCIRQSGARIELILIEKKSDTVWNAISNRTKRLKIGETVNSEAMPGISFRISAKTGEILTIESDIHLTPEILDSIGHMPLPPYIRRPDIAEDHERYQTVFASAPGAVAAPTAGLHFTGSLLETIAARGIETVYCTLFVSWGTFMPVRVRDISLHRMHSEQYHLSEHAAEAVNSARRQGRRIVAVGTTVLRVLESTFSNGVNIPGRGKTDIFIYPPYTIQSIDAIITNFHTPGSTLLMLVCAFGGRDTVLQAYKTAVDMKYRFFSYGDSMLIE